MTNTVCHIVWKRIWEFLVSRFIISKSIQKIGNICINMAKYIRKHLSCLLLFNIETYLVEYKVVLCIINDYMIKQARFLHLLHLLRRSEDIFHNICFWYLIHFHFNSNFYCSLNLIKCNKKYNKLSLPA